MAPVMMASPAMLHASEAVEAHWGTGSAVAGRSLGGNAP